MTLLLPVVLVLTLPGYPPVRVARFETEGQCSAELRQQAPGNPPAPGTLRLPQRGTLACEVES